MRGDETETLTALAAKKKKTSWCFAQWRATHRDDVPRTRLRRDRLLNTDPLSAGLLCDGQHDTANQEPDR